MKVVKANFEVVFSSFLRRIRELTHKIDRKQPPRYLWAISFL